MNDILKAIVIAVLAGLVAGLIGLFIVNQSDNVGGVYHSVKEYYGEGLDVSGGLTADTGTFSNTLNTGGDLTVSSDKAVVSGSASTTLVVGDSATGCLILGHSISGEPVYITVTSSTITATTTKPSICQ